MSRSKWKGSFVNQMDIKKNFASDSVARNSTIPSSCLGKFVNIYSGKEYRKIYISKEKIGLKFGMLVYTKKGKPKTKVIRNKK